MKKRKIILPIILASTLFSCGQVQTTASISISESTTDKNTTTNNSNSSTENSTQDFSSSSVLEKKVNLVQVSADNLKPYPGDVVHFTSLVIGENLEDEDKAVTYTILSGQEACDGEILEEGTLKISSSAIKDTKITVKATSVFDSEKSNTIDLVVQEIVDPTKVSSIKIRQKTIDMQIDETYQLEVMVYPDTAVNKNVTYTSSDEQIATVSETGLVTAISKGTCLITATSEDGGFIDTASINITGTHPTDINIIVPEGENVILTKDGFNMPIGATVKLSYSLSPDDAIGGVTFSARHSWSDASSYVTVTEDGEITALKAASSGLYIVATSTDKKVSKEIELEITTETNFLKSKVLSLVENSDAIEKEKAISGSITKTNVVKKSSTDTKTEENYTIYNDTLIRTVNETDNKATDETKKEKVKYGYDGIYNNKYYHLEKYDSAESFHSTSSTKDITTSFTSDDAKEACALSYFSSSVRGFGSEIKNAVNTYLKDISSTSSTIISPLTFTNSNNSYELKGSFAYSSSSGWYKTQEYRVFDLSFTLSNNLVTTFNYEYTAYDSTGFDFTNNVLKDGAIAIQNVKESASQTTGERSATPTELVIEPSMCFFTDFELEASTSMTGAAKTAFNVNDSISIRPKNALPATASTQFDKITFKEFKSNDDGAFTVSNNNIKAVKEGKATLVFQSSTGIEREITLTSSYADIESVSFASSVKDAVKAGNSMKISLQFQPYGSTNQNFNLSIKEGEAYANITSNTDGTYNLNGNSAGKVVIQATTVGKPIQTIEKTIWVYDTDLTSSSDILPYLKGKTFNYTTSDEDDTGKVTTTYFKLVFDATEQKGTIYKDGTILATFDYEVSGLKIKASNIVTTTSTSVSSFSTFELQSNGCAISMNCYILGIYYGSVFVLE